MDGTVQSLKTELSFVEPMISRLELNEANDKLEYINDKLDEMYDLIEHEVKAKNEVEETKDVITDDLFKSQRYELYTLKQKLNMFVRITILMNQMFKASDNLK